MEERRDLFIRAQPLSRNTAGCVCLIPFFQENPNFYLLGLVMERITNQTSELALQPFIDAGLMSLIVNRFLLFILWLKED